MQAWGTQSPNPTHEGPWVLICAVSSALEARLCTVPYVPVLGSDHVRIVLDRFRAL